MDKSLIMKTAQEAGFTKTAVISTDEIVFNEEFRKYCEENTCGNYDQNYGCPPYCGTPKEMKERVMQYNNAIVFQSRTQVADIFDGEKVKVLQENHTKMTQQVMKRLEDSRVTMDGFAIMCGPCLSCKECRMPKGEPCLKEQERFSCVSAYCIDVVRLAESCEMEIQWDGDIIYYFSLYILDRKLV